MVGSVRPTYDGVRATVMGLGRFGGGAGAVRFLAARGARITLTDTASEAALAESLAQLDGVPIQAVHLGGHREEDFTRADLVIATPAVPRSNRFLQLARRAGVPVTSEMNLFWTHNRGRPLGVTGSNGKSTTSALIHSMLKRGGFPCRLGGNIGHSLLPEVDEIAPDEWVILELSSFQLEDLDAIRASPQVAVVTNFSPNHLDWHGTIDRYRNAKQTILRWQSPNNQAVLNANDPDVSAWPVNGQRLAFAINDPGTDAAFLAGQEAVIRLDGRETAFPLSDWLRLPGRHNVQNALAATCAAVAAGADLAAVKAGLEGYEPLPHRLELVAEAAGRRFYNDSLATTPESAVVALEAFDGPVVLLAGGYDKRVDLGAMAVAAARKAKAVALMGQTATSLQRLIHNAAPLDGGPLTHVCGDFAEAFAWAASQSAPGDVVLLSPGCASYDWFRNFADRGRQFADLARAWGLATQSPLLSTESDD